jgi:hypothetical protein
MGLGCVTGPRSLIWRATKNHWWTVVQTNGREPRIGRILLTRRCIGCALLIGALLLAGGVRVATGARWAAAPAQTLRLLSGSLFAAPRAILPRSAAPLPATEGMPFSGQVASVNVAGCQYFTDANQASATIDWGDGQSSQATITSPSGGQLDISGSHTYAEEGFYSATVSGTWHCNADTFPYPFSASFAFQVADAPLTATGTGPLKATAGEPLNTTVADFSDADPGGTASDYSATIDWGDGSAPTAGEISAAAGGGFAVAASHTYAAAGSYTVSVKIADAGGSQAQSTDSVSVAPAPPTSPAIAVSPASLHFHVDWSAYSLASANSDPQTLTVASVGGAPLRIASVKITGQDAAGLVIACPGATRTKPCHGADGCSGATLAPGQSCQIQLQYLAADVYPSPSGELGIDSNAPSSPTTVALSATSTDLDTQPPPGVPPPPGGCPGTIGSGPDGYPSEDGGLRLTGCWTDLQSPQAEEQGAYPLWRASGDVSINGVTLVPFSADDELYFTPSYDEGGRVLVDWVQATGSDTRYLVVAPEPPKLLELSALGCYVCNAPALGSLRSARSSAGLAARPNAARAAFPPSLGGPECAGCATLALSGYLPPPGLALGVIDLGTEPLVCGDYESQSLPAGPLPVQPCLQSSWPFAATQPPLKINGLPVLGGEIGFQDCGGGDWSALVSANAELPSLFSQGPDMGGPVTDALQYLGCPQPPPNDCSEGCLPESSGGAGAGDCIGTTCYGNTSGHGRPPTRAQIVLGAGAARRGRAPEGPSRPAGPGVSLRSAGAQDDSGGPCPSDQQDVLGSLGDAFVGGMGFGQPYLCYDPATDVWTVGGKFDVLSAQVDSGPPPDYGIGFHSDGRFDHGGIESVDFGDPGVGIIPPFVYLNDFGGAFRVDPTFITAHAKLTVADLVRVDGGGFAVWATPQHPYTYRPLCDTQGNCTDPIPGVDQLQADGPITTFAAGAGGTVSLTVPELGDLPLGGAYLAYIDPGYFEFGGHVCLGTDPTGQAGSCAFPQLPFYIAASVLGALDAQSKDFNIQGGLTVCADFPWPVNTQCLSLQGLVSNQGVGACLNSGEGQPNPHKPPQGGVGFRYQWGGEFVPFLADCNLSPIFVDV